VSFATAALSRFACSSVVEIPAQIVQTGRRIVYRLLGYQDWVATLLRTFDRIAELRLT